MAPIAISPPSPSLDSTTELTKAGEKDILSKTVTNSSHPTCSNLDSSKIKITRTTSPKEILSPTDPRIANQNMTTDHMFTAKWTEAEGWAAPQIEPYGPLSIQPIASVLHYATECFEGMKVYRGYDGKLRIFRPMRNAQRLLGSATRIALPGFQPEEFVKCLEKFLSFEMTKWLPDTEEWRGKFIYLRPTMIATAPAIGVQRPKEALLYIVAVYMANLDEPQQVSPASVNGGAVGKPIKQGMKLLASQHDTVRAWPGGFGSAKVGANYGPTLVAQGEARARGFDQVLWLFGEECFVTEAGGSNFFVLWKKPEDGSLELVTAPLGEGVILPGVTRASVLEIVKQRFTDVTVTERRFTMPEIIQAEQEGRLLEAFGSGTAFFIASCSDIHFRGVDLTLPLAHGVQPSFALKVKQTLKDIMYGTVNHEWAIIIDEE